MWSGLYHRHRHHLFGGALWKDLAGAFQGMVIEVDTSIITASAGWRNLKGGLKGALSRTALHARKRVTTLAVWSLGRGCNHR
jgi:hypothetical protein